LVPGWKAVCFAAYLGFLQFFGALPCAVKNSWHKPVPE